MAYVSFETGVTEGCTLEDTGPQSPTRSPTHSSSTAMRSPLLTARPEPLIRGRWESEQTPHWANKQFFGHGVVEPGTPVELEGASVEEISEILKSLVENSDVTLAPDLAFDNRYVGTLCVKLQGFLMDDVYAIRRKLILK